MTDRETSPVQGLPERAVTMAGLLRSAVLHYNGELEPEHASLLLDAAMLVDAMRRVLAQEPARPPTDAELRTTVERTASRMESYGVLSPYLLIKQAAGDAQHLRSALARAVPRGEPSPAAIQAAVKRLRARHDGVNACESVENVCPACTRDALRAAYAVDRLPAGAPDALREALAIVQEKTAHRSDVSVHDYGGPEIPDGVHRPDCRWCRIEAGALPAGGEGGPDYKAMLEELAQAAQDYLLSGQFVGVTEDEKRRLHHRLGSLAGPHLIAKCALPQRETEEP